MGVKEKQRKKNEFEYSIFEWRWREKKPLINLSMESGCLCCGSMKLKMFLNDIVWAEWKRQCDQAKKVKNDDESH